MLTIAKSKFFSRYLPMFLSVVVIVVSIFTYLTLHNAKNIEAAWYNGSWSSRKLITIDHNKVSGVASSTLSNFPIEFNVTDPDLKYLSFGGSVASSTGADILFTAGDGVTALNYEIESYASSTGATIAWVKIPILSAVTDTSIYVYFGNASAPANTTANSQGTWDSNYKVVYHLPNGTTLTTNDSTSNVNTGTPTNSPTATAGKIGGAANFVYSSSAGQHINTPSINLGTSFTASAWVNLTAEPNGTGSYYRVFENYYGSGLYLGTDGGSSNARWLFIVSNNFTLSLGTLSLNTPTYLVASYDGTNAYFYINGILAGSSAETAPSVGSSPISIGANEGNANSGEAWNGWIDESRFSIVPRSADWVKTEYNNQSSPSTFLAYSALSKLSDLVASGRISQTISWYNNAWSYRKPITIDHNKVVSTTSTVVSIPFSSTGSNSWVVPAGITSITTKAWGAGGGGGGSGGSGASGGAGGGGGYAASSTLVVTPGETLTIDVGGGGGGATAGCIGSGGGGTAGAGTTGHGGAGGTMIISCSGPGGGGGGGSFVLRSATILIAAGGGGGGGGTEAGGGAGAGGAGGVNGANSTGGCNATGGTAGGSGSSNGAIGVTAAFDASAGGGGGGGKLGGSGGGAPSCDSVGAAGGGGGTNFGSSTTNGSGTTPGNNSDPAYTGSVGVGGAAQTAGQNGYVVVSYTVIGLSNFPVEVSVTDLDLRYTGSGGKVASSTGADILFTDFNGTALLNYEIESYASTTGQLIAWVKIPALLAANDTAFYIYFGNASAPANTTANSQGTWDSNYQLVYHLSEANNATSPDSTSNANNSSSASATKGSGQIGNGQSFVSGSTNKIITPSVLAGATKATLSGWYKRTAVSNNISFDNDAVNNSIGFIQQSTNTFITFGTSQYAFYAGPNDTNWHFAEAVYDQSQSTQAAQEKLYIDGVSQSLSYSGVVPASLSAAPINLGYDVNNAVYSDGSLDEVRVSNIARSSDWIATEYNNQNSPSTFYAYGAIQYQTPTTPGDKFSSRGTGTSWYSSSWSYRKQITIDHTKVGVGTTTALSNFPMLFSTTDSDLKYTGSGGKVASSTGADIIFTNSDGTTLLNYEIESYASATGQTIAWVKVPVLSALTDTTIYVYFGNASAPANSSGNSQGTWDSNYLSVSHLPNGTTLTTNDSTSNSNTGTPVNGPTATTGKIQGGASFVSGSSQYIVGSNTINTALTTISTWIFLPAIPGSNSLVVGFQNGLSSGIYDKDIYIDSSGKLNFYAYDGGTKTVTSSNAIATGQWVYLTATADGTNMRIYANGLLVGTTACGNTFNGYSVPDFFINGIVNGGVFAYQTDSLDEVRVSSIARSVDWIATEYNNQNSPSTFYAYSAVGANSRQTSGGASLPAIKARGGVRFR